MRWVVPRGKRKIKFLPTKETMIYGSWYWKDFTQWKETQKNKKIIYLKRIYTGCVVVCLDGGTCIDNLSDILTRQLTVEAVPSMLQMRISGRIVLVTMNMALLVTRAITNLSVDISIKGNRLGPQGQIRLETPKELLIWLPCCFKALLERS